MIFPHVVVLQPSSAVVDERGNLVRRHSIESLQSVAFVQPRSATEDGQTVSDLVTVYLPAGAPRLDAFSRIQWGESVYEAQGAAVELHTPTGRHHWRVEVRRVGS